MIKKLLVALTLFSGIHYSFSQDNYLDFDGINDYVNVTNSQNLLANATAITLGCKVYPQNVSSGFPDFSGFAGYRNESNFDFYLIQLSSTQLEARFRNSSGTAFTITYNSLTLNQWTHFFLVYNGSTLKLYANGTEVGSVAASGSVPSSNSGTFKIGYIPFQTYNWYHDGYVDETSLWNKALSQSEITTIINNDGEIPNPQAETNLKAYYKFNQGTPYGSNAGLTTLNDEMSNANGTLINFALTGNVSNWGGATLSATSFTKNKISVYPTLAADIINFSSEDNISNIQIIDLSGRVVITEDFENKNEISINVSQLNQGVYMAIINNNQNFKFIKK
jgi:hypothetical protein